MWLDSAILSSCESSASQWLAILGFLASGDRVAEGVPVEVDDIKLSAARSVHAIETGRVGVLIATLARRMNDRLISLPRASQLIWLTDQYPSVIALGLPIACSNAAPPPATFTELPTQAPYRMLFAGSGSRQKRQSGPVSQPPRRGSRISGAGASPPGRCRNRHSPAAQSAHQRSASTPWGCSGRQGLRQ